MITVDVRKQGGAAVMTIPADVLKTLDIGIGTKLDIDVGNNAFTVRPARQRRRKRHTLKELLRGVTPKKMARLNKETAFAREGDPIGREIW
jgi:antitoxin ChpS